jgi:hypothetical protein
VGNNGALYIDWVVGSDYWFGAAAISAPGLAPAGASVVAVKQLDNQLDVFFVGLNGALYVDWVVGSNYWSGAYRIT